MNFPYTRDELTGLVLTEVDELKNGKLVQGPVTESIGYRLTIQVRLLLLSIFAAQKDIAISHPALYMFLYAEEPEGHATWWNQQQVLWNQLNEEKAASPADYLGPFFGSPWEALVIRDDDDDLQYFMGLDEAKKNEWILVAYKYLRTERAESIAEGLALAGWFPKDLENLIIDFALSSYKKNTL